MKQGSDTSICTEACKTADGDSNKNQGSENKKCVWYINSPDHFNCFWHYVHDKSSPDGSMCELVQSQIASLMGWSNTKTHFMLKQATIDLIAALKANNANQLLGQDSEASVGFDVVIDTIYPPSSDDE